MPIAIWLAIMTFTVRSVTLHLLWGLLWPLLLVSSAIYDYLCRYILAIIDLRSVGVCLREIFLERSRISSFTHIYTFTVTGPYNYIVYLPKCMFFVCLSTKYILAFMYWSMLKTKQILLSRQLRNDMRNQEISTIRFMFVTNWTKIKQNKHTHTVFRTQREAGSESDNLTTSGGIFFKSSKGVSMVFVSTFRMTTSSRARLLTFCKTQGRALRFKASWIVIALKVN